MATGKLTHKRELFCNYYIECRGNASEAYRMAFNAERMSDAAISVEASRILNDPSVSLCIKELQSELKDKSDISKERVLGELDAILDAKITDYVDLVTQKIPLPQTGEGAPEIKEVQSLVFKDFSTLTERQVKAIESVKQGRNGIELKLHGKSWTIERICKMLGYDSPERIENKVVSEFENMTDDELREYVYGEPANVNPEG